MIWLAGGVLYSIAYLMAGSYLRGNGQALLWLRILALLVPPLTGIFVIARRRRDWTGCQWLFWATVALGLSMMGIGVVGWTVDEVLLGRETSWLGWYTVFALFGAVAPLLALLAQPHRGAREPMMASIAVDMAGIAVMTGFLYSHFAVGADLAPLAARARRRCRCCCCTNSSSFWCVPPSPSRRWRPVARRGRRHTAAWLWG